MKNMCQGRQTLYGIPIAHVQTASGQIYSNLTKYLFNSAQMTLTYRKKNANHSCSLYILHSLAGMQRGECFYFQLN